MTWKCLVFTGTICICFKEISLKMSYQRPFEDIRRMSLIGVPENIFSKTSWMHFPQNKNFKAMLCICFKDIFLKMSCPRPFQDIRRMSWKRIAFTGNRYQFLFYSMFFVLFLGLKQIQVPSKHETFSRHSADIFKGSWTRHFEKDIFKMCTKPSFKNFV